MASSRPVMPAIPTVQWGFVRPTLAPRHYVEQSAFSSGEQGIGNTVTIQSQPEAVPSAAGHNFVRPTVAAAAQSSPPEAAGHNFVPPTVAAAAQSSPPEAAGHNFVPPTVAAAAQSSPPEAAGHTFVPPTVAAAAQSSPPEDLDLRAWTRELDEKLPDGVQLGDIIAYLNKRVDERIQAWQPQVCRALKPEELAELYDWVNSVTHPKSDANIAEDFADGVLFAKMVDVVCPRLVVPSELTEDCANDVVQMRANWHLINTKVMTRLKTSIADEDIDDVIMRREGAIERVLYHMWQKADALGDEELLGDHGRASDESSGQS